MIKTAQQQVPGGRKKATGFSFDRDGTQIIDDAFTIVRYPDGSWAAQISIADAPSVVQLNDGNDLDGRASYFRDENTRPLTKDFSLRYLSLQEKVMRPAVTITILLNSAFQPVWQQIQRTAFMCEMNFGYSEFDKSLKGGSERAQLWLEFAKGLRTERLGRLEQSGVKNLKGNDVRVFAPSASSQNMVYDADFMVSEVMRIANKAAAKYMVDNGVPCRPRKDDVVTIERENSISNPNARRWLQDAVKGVHKSLVADALPYVKVTSPMQKYPELAMLRNLTDHLDGRKPSHDNRDVRMLIKGRDCVDPQICGGHPHEKTKPLRSYFAREAGSSEAASILGGNEDVQSAQYSFQRAGNMLYLSALCMRGSSHVTVDISADENLARQRAAEKFIRRNGGGLGAYKAA